jgi:hypothetical protein
MIVIGTQAQGAAKRRFLQLPDGFSYHKGEWLESSEDPLLSPTAFLIEQPAGSVLAPHFHKQNQFQVMVDGGGTIGRHGLAPITVHYAGAYSGYGPLIAGPEGIKYFTIRAVFEKGAMMVATDRDRMIRGPKRQVSTEPHQPFDEAALAALAAPQCVDLVALAPDGLAVQVWRLPPNTEARPLSPNGGSGQFQMVLAGALRHHNALLRRWEMRFISNDEAAQALAADEAGAEVLILQMPPKAGEYQPASL